jgi:hypothetical protein
MSTPKKTHKARAKHPAKKKPAPKKERTRAQAAFERFEALSHTLGLCRSEADFKTVAKAIEIAHDSGEIHHEQAAGLRRVLAEMRPAPAAPLRAAPPTKKYRPRRTDDENIVLAAWGAHLRAARKRCGLRMVDMAEQLNVKPTRWQLFEVGRQPFPAYLVAALCGVLHIPPAIVATWGHLSAKPRSAPTTPPAANQLTLPEVGT